MSFHSIFLGTSVGRPNIGDKEQVSTTPESVDSIFHKYNQQYPYHGGAVEQDVQNDEPAMQSIIERLNEIINDDKPSDFKAPSVDASPKQRSLLRQQKEELVFGSVHINQPIRRNTIRVNPERSNIMNLAQNGFINRELLADSRVPEKSRIPTRFPTRRPTTNAPVVFHETAAGETITDLIVDALLTKPEGNKLSIPVLSVATEDFEEDIPGKQITHSSAQTDDFEEESKYPPRFRNRRQAEWLMNRMSSWLSFGGNVPEEEAESSKVSTLIKRQTTEDVVQVEAEPVPIPEHVKSIDVAPKVADAVIETILDIEDPEARKEFAHDVPAIEDKLEALEEQAEANNSTVEVSLVELGETEPEQLGTIEEDESEDEEIPASAILPEEPVNVQSEPQQEPIIAPGGTTEGPAILARSNDAVADVVTEPTTSAPVFDVVTPVAIPAIEKVTSEADILPVEITTIDTPVIVESVTIPIANDIEIPVAPADIPLVSEITETEATPAIESRSEITTENITTIAEEKELSTVDCATVATIAETPSITPITVETPVSESEVIPETTAEVESLTTPEKPLSQTATEITSEIVIEPEPIDEASPRLLPVIAGEKIEDNSTPVDSVPETLSNGSVQLTDISQVEETVLLTDSDSTNQHAKPTDEDPSVPLVVAEEEVDFKIHSLEFNHSGSDSLSISTTESTSDAEEIPLVKESSEEERDSSKEKSEKQKQQNKKSSSEEQDRPKSLFSGPNDDEVEQKMTKEDMLNIFSQPETETKHEKPDSDEQMKSSDPAVIISEIAEAQNKFTVDHVVIKKDGVTPKNQDDGDSVESDEQISSTTPDVLQQLDDALKKEIVLVAAVLNDIQEAIDNAEDEATTEEEAAVTETATTVPEIEVANSVITSKNTRHLAVGYNGAEYLQKEILEDVIEARLGRDLPQAAAEAGFLDYNSRAFVLVGSGLFLVVGCILFSLVVLMVKRSGRYGSIDLTIEP